MDHSHTVPLVITDDNTHLYINEVGTLSSQEEVNTTTGRVFFNYSFLSNKITVDGESFYNIRLNRFYQLHTEDIKVLSQMTPEEVENIGTDAVGVYQASVGGGYVNINFCYTYNPVMAETFVHDVDLIYDDVNFSDGRIHLLLRHKGDGSTSTSYINYKTASFRLVAPLDSPENTGKTLVLDWSWYDDSGQRGTYTGSMNFSPFAGVLSSNNTVRDGEVPLRVH